MSTYQYSGLSEAQNIEERYQSVDEAFEAREKGEEGGKDVACSLDVAVRCLGRNSG